MSGEEESIYVQVARCSLESTVRGEGHPKLPDKLPPELERPGGAFVSIKKKGMLRGCIGTVLPAEETLAQEIAANAVSAGTADPRFAPVTEEELEELEYSVDVLTKPEKVTDLSELDPQRYGVIVRSGRRTGLLLPALNGIDTVEQQLSIARQKAGISPEDPVEIYRFQSIRHY